MRVENGSHPLSLAGSSSAQLPLALSTRFFTSLSMTLLAASVYPLFCGYSLKVALCLLLRFMRNSSTSLSMNCFPLSEIKVFQILKQQTMFFQMNFWTFFAKMVAMGSA